MISLTKKKVNKQKKPVFFVKDKSLTKKKDSFKQKIDVRPRHGPSAGGGRKRDTYKYAFLLARPDCCCRFDDVILFVKQDGKIKPYSLYNRYFCGKEVKIVFHFLAKTIKSVIYFVAKALTWYRYYVLLNRGNTAIFVTLRKS